MPIVEWNDSFLLGVPKIDQHHQHLVELLNQTYDQFRSGATGEELGSVIDELIEYATYHFTYEEHWLEKISYPQLDGHKEEHERFTRRFGEIQHDFHDKNINLSLEVISFLVSWVTDHIKKTDAAYARFITAKHDTVGER